MVETRDPKIQHLYDLLSILDSKAAALLGFNAIFLTALSVWLGYIKPNLMHLILDLVFLVLLVSCGLLLSVIFLKWSPEDDTVAGATELARVRKFRTRCYTAAWGLSATSILIVFLVAAVHTVGTGLKASDNCGCACQTFFSEDIFGNVDNDDTEADAAREAACAQPAAGAADGAEPSTQRR